MTGWREINLLCPGPSLRRANPDPSLLTVGINLAIEFTPLDWWAVGDDKPIREALVLPRIGIGTKQSNIDGIRRNEIRPKCAWNDKLHLFTFDHYRNRGKPWYTVWYALLMCRTLGASVLHIYGMDMKGDSYYKDAPYEGKFTDVRWKTESKVTLEILTEFQQRDKITIINH